MKYAICVLWIFLFPASMCAQWSSEDSVRLQNILSGKEEIRLNPEFQRAIENGTFISTDKPLDKMKSSPLELPITSDFSEYIRADTFRLKAQCDSITPAVYLLQHLKRPPSLGVPKQAYTSPNPLIRRAELKFGKLPVYGKVSAGNLFLNEVKDGQSSGSINVTIRVEFSMEDILEHIFWKSARDKKRNRKRENTWKYYNDYP